MRNSAEILLNMGIAVAPYTENQILQIVARISHKDSPTACVWAPASQAAQGGTIRSARVSLTGMRGRILRCAAGHRQLRGICPDSHISKINPIYVCGF